MLFEVKAEDFAASFGTTHQDILEKCGDLIRKHNFSYEVYEGSERDNLILSILRRIDADQQIVGAPERKQVWQNGWEETKNEFLAGNFDLSQIVPKFIRFGHPIRFNKKYIKTTSPSFELDFFSVFRQWLFKTYFSSAKTVYEFGCGTGFNLVALAILFPEKTLWGTDFAQSSVDLINILGKQHNLNLKGHYFDMFSPPSDFPLAKDSIVFSIGAIEQLAGNFGNLFDFILRQTVGLCVHVEPVIELYEETDLVDYLAIKFQGKRGYTKGLLPHLKNLESEGVIKIEKIQRLFFGSQFMEGYNLLVWKKLS